jgi:hypothetical protein
MLNNSCNWLVESNDSTSITIGINRVENWILLLVLFKLIILGFNFWINLPSAIIIIILLDIINSIRIITALRFTNWYLRGPNRKIIKCLLIAV